jgi:hypothetical protein
MELRSSKNQESGEIEMTIQKKSLITNRAAAKKAIIATHSASTKFSATSAVAARAIVGKGATHVAKGFRAAKGIHSTKIVAKHLVAKNAAMVGKAGRLSKKIAN